MNQKLTSNRRAFLKAFGFLAGASMVSGRLSWVETALADNPDKIIRLGVIGTGSRANLLLIHLKEIPGLEIACLCDNYEPNLSNTHQKFPNAVTYNNHLELLEKEQIDGVIIATPLHVHAQVTIDALNAGLHVFCEKSMAKTYQECNDMVTARNKAGKILTIGHQRMFDVKYLQAYKMIEEGKIGKPTQIRAYWHRNNNWRRAVPDPSLERKINWRLYHEYSLGLMTELGSHHFQVANQVLGEVPQEVWGAGSINYWKDGREVFDNVNLVYKYPGGTNLIYDSLISNKKHGRAIQVMGPKGTLELEEGRMWDETPPPAPAILKLINDIEHDIFDAIPIGGASWVPETPVKDKGELIIDEVLISDGTRAMLEAFVANVRDNRIVLEETRQGFYSGISSIMGFEAMMENRIVKWPEGLFFN